MNKLNLEELTLTVIVTTRNHHIYSDQTIYEAKVKNPWSRFNEYLAMELSLDEVVESSLKALKQYDWVVRMKLVNFVDNTGVVLRTINLEEVE